MYGKIARGMPAVQVKLEIAEGNVIADIPVLYVKILAAMLILQQLAQNVSPRAVFHVQLRHICAWLKA